MAKRDLCLESSVPLLVLSGGRNSVGGRRRKEFLCTVLRGDAVLCALLQADKHALLQSHCRPVWPDYVFAACGKNSHMGSKERNKNLAKARAGKGDRKADKNYFMDGIAKVFLPPPFVLRSTPSPFFCFPLAGREEGPKGKKTFFLPQSLVCTVYGAAACCTYCTRRLRWWGGLYLGVWRRRGKKVSGGGGNKTLVPATQAQTVESAGKLKLLKHKLRNGFLWDPAAAARAPFSHHYVFKCLKYPPEGKEDPSLRDAHRKKKTFPPLHFVPPLPIILLSRAKGPTRIFPSLQPAGCLMSLPLPLRRPLEPVCAV